MEFVRLIMDKRLYLSENLLKREGIQTRIIILSGQAVHLWRLRLQLEDALCHIGYDTTIGRIDGMFRICRFSQTENFHSLQLKLHTYFFIIAS